VPHIVAASRVACAQAHKLANKLTNNHLQRTTKQAELLLSEEAQEAASVTDLKLQLQDLQSQVDEASKVRDVWCAMCDV
jgi:hypothetical protein